MESTNHPGPEDASRLREAFDAMVSSVHEVRFSNGYPIYPEAFGRFTRYLSNSPWHRVDYMVDMKEDLRPRIAELSPGKVRSFLTMMIRLDRFSPGGLLGLIEDGTAERVVARAVALTES